jgi:hypothetical protein
VILRFHRVHGLSDIPTAGGSTRVAKAGISSTRSRRPAIEAGRAGPTGGEVAGRWRYVDGAGEFGGHLVGDPAFAATARARGFGRGQALTRCCSRPRVTTRAEFPAPRRATMTWRPSRVDLVRRGVATPSCARRRTRPAQDREVRDGG